MPFSRNTWLGMLNSSSLTFQRQCTRIRCFYLHLKAQRWWQVFHNPWKTRFTQWMFPTKVNNTSPNTSKVIRDKRNLSLLSPISTSPSRTTLILRWCTRDLIISEKPDIQLTLVQMQPQEPISRIQTFSSRHKIPYRIKCKTITRTQTIMLITGCIS